MRFVKRSSVIAPASIIGDTSSGGRERSKVIRKFSTESRRNGKFTFRAYANPDVKASLDKLFYGKCAYCESVYARTQPVDVEHWRPKSAIQINGHREKPGYYWLAASWENLLPSCIDCNRERYQKIAGSVNDETVRVGKADSFPIDDEDNRCRYPDDELEQEVPLLVHPCEDSDLEAMFEFDHSEPVIRPSDELDQFQKRKAQTSIKTYALNRVGLVICRKELLWQIKQKMETVKNLVNILSKYCSADKPSKKKQEIKRTVEEMIHTELKDLARFMSPRSEYSLMAEQIIKPFIDEITGQR